VNREKLNNALDLILVTPGKAAGNLRTISAGKRGLFTSWRILAAYRFTVLYVLLMVAQFSRLLDIETSDDLQSGRFASNGNWCGWIQSNYGTTPTELPNWRIELSVQLCSSSWNPSGYLPSHPGHRL